MSNTERIRRVKDVQAALESALEKTLRLQLPVVGLVRVGSYCETDLLAALATARRSAENLKLALCAVRPDFKRKGAA